MELRIPKKTKKSKRSWIREPAMHRWNTLKIIRRWFDLHSTNLIFLIFSRFSTKVEYLIKWEGCPPRDNSWEPADSLSCRFLIAHFEEKARKGKLWNFRVIPTGQPQVLIIIYVPDEEAAAAVQVLASSYQEPHERPNGFRRGLSAESIVGATNATGQIEFLIKWRNTNEVQMVPAEEANVFCPLLVIKFYEERLKWRT